MDILTMFPHIVWARRPFRAAMAWKMTTIKRTMLWKPYQ